MEIMPLIFLYVVAVTVGAAVQLFDATSEMCCQGKVHPIEDGGGRFYCCGDLAYDAAISICCQSKVLSKPDINASSTVSCCGQALYDFRTAICCQESVIEFPVTVHDEDQSTTISDMGVIEETEMEVNGSQESVQELRAKPPEQLSMACCGREGYDWRVDMCGEQGVKPRPFPQAEVCGITEELYDVRKQMCCGDSVISTEGVHAVFCCGNQGYDRYSSLCCKGRVKAKPNPDEEYRCCGHEIYNPANEICCDSDNIVVRKPEDGFNSTVECCGQSITVNNHQQTEMCCDGIVHRVQQPEAVVSSSAESSSSPLSATQQLECCGTRVYSPINEVCCSSGVVHSLALLPRSSSRNGTVATDLRNGIGCCGDELLTNPNWDMCCEGRIVGRRSSFTRCCGSSTFESNQNSQVCCNGKVLTRGAASEQCCGDTLYDVITHTCCYESSSYQILEKVGTSTACCSSGI